MGLQGSRARLPRRYRLLLTLILMPALMLGCGLGGKTPSSEMKVPVSQEAADRLEGKLERAFSGDEDAFSLEFTDAELTSYVVLELSRQIDGAEDMPLEDFQVRFAGGQMLLSGKLASVCPFRLDVRAAASARVEDGQLDVSVEEARVGGVPIPRWALESLSRIVTESIVEAPDHVDEAVRLTDVEIGEGVMRISGRVTESGE